MKKSFIKSGTITVILSLVLYASFGQFSYTDSVKFSMQLVNIEQQLMDDISSGNILNWNKYLNSNFFIITEDGSMLEKDAFLKTFSPLPKGYSGYIIVINPKTIFHQNTAVISYVADEYETVFGNKIHTQYSSMNTYIKTDTSWVMLSSQIFEIPLLPPAVYVPANTLKKYIGIYKLTDSITCNITFENDTLFYQRTGRDKIALLPETSNMFFKLSDAMGRKIFSNNDKGVMIMRERRNGQDVIWKRIKKKFFILTLKNT
ncbi:MAG: nuclear transport factor 2 family protein [Parafilimonas sp.]